MRTVLVFFPFLVSTFCHERTHICASKYTKHMLRHRLQLELVSRAYTGIRRSSEKSTRSREHSAKSFPEKVICLFPFPLLFLSFSFFPFFKATHDVFKKRSRKTRRPSTSSKIILKKRQIARFRRNQSPYSVPSRENDPCNFFFPPAKFNLGSNFYFCRIVCNEFCIRVWLRIVPIL